MRLAVEVSAAGEVQPMGSEQIKLLKELAALKQQGILTEEEFAQEKAAIMTRRPSVSAHV